MKKLPEFVALGIGLGCLALAGAVAWAQVETESIAHTEAMAQDRAHAELRADDLHSQMISTRR